MSDISAEDLIRLLPQTLAVFPLEGVLLLPHGQMPLHIFEPRYRNMIEEALGNGRMLGMVQPRTSQPQPVPDEAEIFETGCAGRIVSFTETDDGRFLITLKGVCRFRVSQELPLFRGFRRVIPDYATFRADLEPASEEGIDRPRLLTAARAFLMLKDISCDWQAAEQASSQALVTSLAMSCPFEPEEKQALLESHTLARRSELLISLFEIAMLTTDAPAAGTRH
ncbi:MAG: LON peptidase substrate-binding domain-containing protein [Rhodospirillales bacterium]|nr:LON peptidase substrate-binding domain-containing protein [Rhodospirillales bacterium]